MSTHILPSSVRFYGFEADRRRVQTHHDTGVTSTCGSLDGSPNCAEPSGKALPSSTPGAGRAGQPAPRGDSHADRSGAVPGEAS